MILCQISDLHIKRKGALAYQRVDTAEALRRCLRAIARLRPAPDAVVVTGDLVDLADAQEYAHLRELLAELSLPCYLLVGNHDHREALRQAFPDHPWLGREGFVQYAVDLGPCRLLALDTQDPPHSGGRLCAQRLQWLERELAREPAKPVILAMHHPPFVTGIGHMDKIGLPREDRDGLAELVARHPQIERIVCGHLHRPIQRRFGSSVVSTCPAPAHQVAFDLDPEATPGFRLEPPAMQLHAWIDGEGLVSHLVPIEEYPGPYPFFEPDGSLID
ncbi:phosphodiesterase [Thiomonas sp. FB-6]|uniref:phosphodiesterase n=1 Tax=Thiomonas sp. FB-6 TaxID=1158291 RepID=UPI00037CA507|nr:phosphodiesterase [Thiomonas sp. FB-6]